MAEMPERAGKPSRIAPLGDDRDVDSADLDVRGWEVIAADGERMGIVDELLIDTGTGRVRYLDVDLEDDLVEVATASTAATAERLRAEDRGAGTALDSWKQGPQPTGDSRLGDVNPGFSPGSGDRGAQAPSQRIERQTSATPPPWEGGARHVLLPIGRIRVDERAEQVFLERMGSREAAALPEYRPGASFPALERALAERFGEPDGASTTADAAEERFWRGGGAVDTGTAPPEPGTTPAELAADEVPPATGGSRRGTT
jgi:hypothetical protein